MLPVRFLMFLAVLAMSFFCSSVQAAEGCLKCATGEGSSLLVGRVVHVADGDTLTILDAERRQHRVRFAEIDAPESGQPFGQVSKRRVVELAAQQQVQILVRDIDRYGRIVGEIFLPDGRSLNRLMVEEGLAWHYRYYSKDASLAFLEAQARGARRGLWSQADPVAPWDWRKKR